MKTLQESLDFLEELKEKYKDISSLVSRLKKDSTRKIDDTILKTSISETSQESQYTESFDESNSYKAPSEEEFFAPISIAGKIDWLRLRANVQNLHELEEFFQTQNDSQSPQFLEIITQYKKELEKNLVIPNYIDEETSLLFAEKIAVMIKDRIYTILQTCSAGKLGKGENPVEYYQQIEKHINVYFRRIGLKVLNLNVGDDISRAKDHMKIIISYVKESWQNKKIAEIFVQPHYFEYYRDDGELDEYWIDGKCTVYKN